MMHKSPPPAPSSAPDARIVKTASALRSSLLALLERKSLEQITVREIAAEAGVHYTTFFRHYPSKEALLDFVVADQIDHLFGLAVPLQDTVDTHAAFLALCTHVSENRALWTALLTGGAAATMREELTRASRNLVQHRVREFAWIPVELSVITSVTVIVETLAWWLRQPEGSVTVERAADLMDAQTITTARSKPLTLPQGTAAAEDAVDPRPAKPLERPPSAISATTARLRERILALPDSTFLGDERSLLQTLGVSRATLRQVARVLERDGLLTVKRGANGGYFSSRPKLDSIEAAMTTYLDMLDVGIDELLAIASITWVEIVQQASSLGNDAAGSMAAGLIRKAEAVDTGTSVRELIAAEQVIRSEIFKLIDRPYMALIFQINITFARRKFEGPGQLPDKFERHGEQVAAWRGAKLLELEAIARGDRQLAMIAAERTNRFWNSVLRGSAADTVVPDENK